MIIPDTHVLIRDILKGRRSEVWIARQKVSRELIEKLERVAETRHWSLSKTAYLATAIGVEMILKENEEQHFVNPRLKRS